MINHIQLASNSPVKLIFSSPSHSCVPTLETNQKKNIRPPAPMLAAFLPHSEGAQHCCCRSSSEKTREIGNKRAFSPWLYIIHGLHPRHTRFRVTITKRARHASIIKAARARGKLICLDSARRLKGILSLLRARTRGISLMGAVQVCIYVVETRAERRAHVRKFASVARDERCEGRGCGPLLGFTAYAICFQPPATYLCAQLQRFSLPFVARAALSWITSKCVLKFSTSPVDNSLTFSRLNSVVKFRSRGSVWITLQL